MPTPPDQADASVCRRFLAPSRPSNGSRTDEIKHSKRRARRCETLCLHCQGRFFSDVAPLAHVGRESRLYVNRSSERLCYMTGPHSGAAGMTGASAPLEGQRRSGKLIGYRKVPSIVWSQSLAWRIQLGYQMWKLGIKIQTMLHGEEVQDTSVCACGGLDCSRSNGGHARCSRRYQDCLHQHWLEAHDLHGIIRGRDMAR